MVFLENWQEGQTILVILAHPDDPEFFCGATIARWTQAGHDVHYLLLTKGDKGSNDPKMTPEELKKIRIAEQRAAADILGVKTVSYLDIPDGYLQEDIQTKREVIRVMRTMKPQIVVGCDPSNLYTREGYINHPDHRMAGQIVLDVIYPAVGNRLYYPELLLEGLEPHQVKELWLSIPAEANTVIDVTKHWQTKIEALSQHRSQIGSKKRMIKRMSMRRQFKSGVQKPIYEERFRRIIFK